MLQNTCSTDTHKSSDEYMSKHFHRSVWDIVIKQLNSEKYNNKSIHVVVYIPQCLGHPSSILPSTEMVHHLNYVKSIPTMFVNKKITIELKGLLVLADKSSLISWIKNNIAYQNVMGIPEWELAYIKELKSNPNAKYMIDKWKQSNHKQIEEYGITDTIIHRYGPGSPITLLPFYELEERYKNAKQKCDAILLNAVYKSRFEKAIMKDVCWANENNRLTNIQKEDSYAHSLMNLRVFSSMMEPIGLKTEEDNIRLNVLFYPSPLGNIGSATFKFASSMGLDAYSVIKLHPLSSRVRLNDRINNAIVFMVDSYIRYRAVQSLEIRKADALPDLCKSKPLPDIHEITAGFDNELMYKIKVASNDIADEYAIGKLKGDDIATRVREFAMKISGVKALLDV